MALMAVLVAGMLGALILPVVLAQNRSTRFDMTRVHALHAAQAGVDVAVGKIRASTTPDADGNIFGDHQGIYACLSPGATSDNRVCGDSLSNCPMAVTGSCDRVCDHPDEHDVARIDGDVYPA